VKVERAQTDTRHERQETGGTEGVSVVGVVMCDEHH
jgi:hypothetical protein